MSTLVFQHGIQGLALFAPGIALAVHLIGMRAPAAKHALWGLAWFALARGAYEWFVLASELEPGLNNPALKFCFGALAYAPLAYFSLCGFGWRVERVHRVVALAAVGCLLVILASDGSPRALDLTLQWLIRAPLVIATIAAVFAGPALQGLSKSDPAARVALTVVIGVYAFAKILAALLPYLNAGHLQPAFDIVLTWVRIGSWIVALLALLRMLYSLSDDMIGELRERAAQSEAQFQTTLEVDPECIKLLDEQGTVLEMNAAGLAIIGAASIDEVRGTSFYSLIRPEHHDAYREALTKALSGEASAVQFEIVGLDGVRHWVRQHAARLQAGGQKGAQRIIAVTLDVTANVTMQELLQASKSAAAGRADANNSMSSFLLHLSHEFKTPLSAIVGYGELLREAAHEQGRAGDVRDLDCMLEAAGTLRKLVEGLLNVARIEAARTYSTPSQPQRGHAA